MTTSASEEYEVYSDMSDKPIVTFEVATPEQVAQWELDAQNTPAEYYEEGCENLWDENGKPFPDGETCGGKVVSTGGQGYYNGSYDCYTLYLHCDRCGDYEVECV